MRVDRRLLLLFLKFKNKGSARFLELSLVVQLLGPLGKDLLRGHALLLEFFGASGYRLAVGGQKDWSHLLLWCLFWTARNEAVGVAGGVGKLDICGDIYGLRHLVMVPMVCR